MRYFTLFLFITVHQVFSQSFIERELKTEITEATVFVQGAQITRTGKSEIISGRSILKIKSLSPHIDDKSVQVKGTGDFTILSVNHKLNYLNRLQRDEKIDSLKEKILSIDYEISTSQSRLEILSEKQSVLDKNKNLGGMTSGATLIQIKQAIDFYDAELTSIKSEELKTRFEIQQLNDKKGRIEQEISNIAHKDDLPSGEIEIRVETEKKVTGDFKITYLVANAGWYPKYDVRVNSIEEPLELRYKADVYQNTGINWDNVKLRLSNGNPNKSGVFPDLQAWYLNYARNTIYNRPTYDVLSNAVRNVSGKVLTINGEPLPGATVVVKGTTIGTVTDIGGSYSLTLPNGATHLVISFIGYASKELPISSTNMTARLEEDVHQLSEVIVTGYGIEGRAAGVVTRDRYKPYKEAKTIPTTTIENQTTVEFEVDQPYSIKSNGEILSVDMISFEIPAIYQYYGIPKLDKDAFLMARIINWDQYNLLEGEANLYFEDAYVGRSVLDARALADTLNISLGRDKSIVIGRMKIDEYSKNRTLGSNKVESRAFKIVVRNKKSQPIKLTLFDQLPVAAISDISISATELSNGNIEEDTGEITWDLNLEPQRRVELELGYEVKYPKREKVILE